MPINIYIEESASMLDWLCDENCELPNQIYALEKWLINKGQYLEPSNYIADIRFSIRKDAAGGGAALSSECMAIIVMIGMNVYFSEYRKHQLNA